MDNDTLIGLQSRSREGGREGGTYYVGKILCSIPNASKERSAHVYLSGYLHLSASVCICLHPIPLDINIKPSAQW